MVKSVLDNTITYSESKEIDPTDLDHNANLYETSIYDKDIIFALGKPKYTYIDNNIVYYSIYLVENDAITMQIGIYEILASEQANILDAEGDIDLNKFDKPLLYEFTYGIVKAEHVKAEHVKAEQPDNSKKSKPAQKKTLSKWIQQFMASDNYDIIDTKYDGNCFFSMVQLALEENEQELSIDEMRDILVANATEDLFQNYKTLYDNYLLNEGELTREIKNITKRHKDLTATIKKTKDNTLLKNFEKQFPEIEKKHATLLRDRKETREALQEYAFMKGIDNLSMLKLKIKTSDYWADTWAISTLERELNIKLVIFSELNYREHDEVNVLQCGQLNDTLLEERGIFEPSFYILAAYHGGYHYQMITYNNQKSFDFTELPEAIKQLVAEKCLEKISGPYSLIPEFKEYALKMHTEGPAHAHSALEPATLEPASAQEPIVISSDKEEELSSDLYDSGTVLRFYSKSLDKPRPGKGAGETLGAESYDELARIPQWRKKLANSWPAEFKLDNHKWLTVEHYYQASKFKRQNKEFYIKFSLDSPDSSIAKDVELAKAAGGKSGKFKGELVRPKEVVIDRDFFQKPQGVKFSRGEIEMEAAMRAKFTQHPDLKQLILATKKAKLEHIRRSNPAEVFNDLMRVRRELKETS
jgi:predicted NAD-dependent protein-ADP-ribosyltransferase YbiA (DUF1768 family)